MTHIQHQILPLLSAGIFLFLGALVYRNSREDRVKKKFFRFCYTTFHWQFSWVVLFAVTDRETAGWIARVGYSGIIFLPIAFYDFILTFLNIETHRVRWFYALGAAFLVSLWTSNLFIDGVLPHRFGFYPHAGPLHPLYLLLVLYIIGSMLWKLRGAFVRETHSVIRNQMRYMFFAVLIYCLAAIDYSVNYAAVTRLFHDRLYPVGCVFIVAGSGILTYIILKERALGADIFLRKILLVALLVAFLEIFGFAFDSALGEWISDPSLRLLALVGVMTAMMLTVLTFRIRGNLQIHHLIFDSRDTYRETYKRISGALISLRTLDEILNYVAATLTETMDVAHVQRWRLESGRWTCLGGLDVSATPPEIEALDAFFAGRKPVALSEKVLRGSSVRGWIEELRSEVLLPVCSKGRLIALLAIGPRRSDYVFSSEDLEFLTNLSALLEITVDNAQAFEEIRSLNRKLEEFNRSLEQRVEEKTQELTESYEKLKRSEMAKSRFISSITHELKTPLSIIIGHSEALLEQVGRHSPETVRAVRFMQQSAFQLATHVDRIIKVSVLEDPDYRPDRAAFFYQAVVRNVFLIFEDKARQGQIRFGMDLPEAPLAVDVDLVLIEDVLRNLIQNAFKFTPPGGEIRVRVARDGARVRTEVADTGTGIPSDKLPYIFDRMVQADDVLSKSHGGIGLGLAICKKNVELLGGSIEAASEPGRGTVFTFWLPLLDRAPDGQTLREPVPGRPERRSVRFEYAQTLEVDELADMIADGDLAQYEKPLPGRLTVLIVEDNPGMLGVLAGALSDEYNLLLARTGTEALEKMRLHGVRIMLILSDVMMPGMNGLDFCRAVMAQPDWRRIPLLFISALMGQDEQLQALELGAADYIVKPFNIKILKEKVAFWIARRRYETLMQTLTGTLQTKIEETVRLKDIVLHEIRNPLSIISGADYYVQKLREALLPRCEEREKKWWQMAEKLTTGIESLKGVLETSKKLESHALHEKQPERLADLVNEITEQTRHLLEGVDFSIRLRNVDGQTRIRCDREVLVQVFVNLVRNAAEAVAERKKADPQGDHPGRVEIECGRGDGDQLTIQVRDNGVGIPPQVLENLFRFRYTTKKDGMGVGLHLAKMILNLHGGKIEVASIPGKGTTFTTYLPLNGAIAE